MRRLVLLLVAACVLACTTATAPLRDPMGNGGAREQWLFDQRAYPFGDVPVDARRRALDEVRGRERVRSNAAGTVSAQWRAIGPSPVQTRWPWKSATGRVKAVAISPRDPNIVLAGSSSGGIWRSVDGGETFLPVSDTHSDLSVGAIAFAPSDPAIAYAVSGSDFLGTGVLRSKDAGATWQVVDGPSFAPRGTANRMVIDPLNADRLWVAQTSRQDANSGNTFSSGLLLSEDGGFSWTTLFRGLVSDFAADPSDGNTFLLGVPRNDGGTGGAGVYRSTDAGRTWTQVFAGRGAFPRFTFAFSPASPSRVTMHAFMENAGRMHASDDGGRTWTELSAAPPEGRTSFLAAHPSRPDQLYLGYPGSDLQVSIDSCASWQNVTRNRDANGRFDPTQSLTHIDQHALVFSPADERVLYLANDGGLYRSTDGGGSFTSLNGTLSLVQAYGIAAHPSDPAMLFLGTQDNGLERRTDGEWRELITGDYGSILFDANNPGNIVSNYVFGTILAFGGNGSTYLDERTSSATFGETEPYRIQFIAPFERHPRTNELYFGTWKLHVSADFGRTWTAMAGGLDLTHGISDTLSAIGLARNDPGVLYTGSAMGRVMRSRDGGATWVSVTNGLPSRYVKALHVDPRDGNRVWVAFSGYRSAHVYRTLDGGATWQALSSGLPDVPVNALLLDPDSPDRVYAGTDIGVFILEGEAWRHLGEGMPPVVVTRFAVTADGRIVAATYGRGAYELVAGEPTRRRRVRH